MKINVNTPLLSIRGTALKTQDDGDAEARDMLLADAMLGGLMSMRQEDTPKDKFDLHGLATRVVLAQSTGGEMEMTVDDAARIKNRIGQTYGQAVVGPAWSLLDG